VVGYTMIKSIAEGIKKAKSTETEKLITAFRGLSHMSPFGPITYRADDHQSTMGAYVGKTKNEGGKGIMVDYVYLDGGKYLPPPAEVKKLRPAEL
jgi:branched-chain amino acid transport system substrate-binding protein